MDDLKTYQQKVATGVKDKKFFLIGYGVALAVALLLVPLPLRVYVALPGQLLSVIIKAACFGVMIYLAWLRGPVVGKGWLVALPIGAALVDFAGMGLGLAGLVLHGATIVIGGQFESQLKGVFGGGAKAPAAPSDTPAAKKDEPAPPTPPDVG